jgi:hypothetical protein
MDGLNPGLDRETVNRNHPRPECVDGAGDDEVPKCDGMAFTRDEKTGAW